MEAFTETKGQGTTAYVRSQPTQRAHLAARRGVATLESLKPLGLRVVAPLQRALGELSNVLHFGPLYSREELNVSLQNRAQLLSTIDWPQGSVPKNYSPEDAALLLLRRAMLEMQMIIAKSIVAATAIERQRQLQDGLMTVVLSTLSAKPYAQQ